MEGNNYLNKALKDAQKALKQAEAQKREFNNAFVELKKVFIKNGGSETILKEMEQASKARDLDKLREIQNRFK
jgi:thioredoxin-like negative regulator of GroEL